MEILVILMLGTVFFAIAMFIISFIMIKKHHVDKAYAKGENELYFDEDDDDEVDNQNNSLEEPIASDEKNDTLELEVNNYETFDEVSIEDNSNITLKEEGNLIESSLSNESKLYETSIDIIVPKIDKQKEEVKENENTDLQEVVNVIINKKNYIFLANNNVVSKVEHVKILLNKKIYYGLITKGNYKRDIKSLKSKPYKLVIIKNNKNKKDEIEVLNLEEIEFVPKRKKQN